MLGRRATRAIALTAIEFPPFGEIVSKRQQMLPDHLEERGPLRLPARVHRAGRGCLCACRCLHLGEVSATACLELLARAVIALPGQGTTLSP